MQQLDLNQLLQSLGTLCLILTPLFIGFKLPTSQRVNQLADTGLGYVVFIILTYLGVELAQIEGLHTQILSILSKVSLLVLLTVGFGMLGVWLFDRLLPWRPVSQDTTTTKTVSMWGSFIQLMCVVVGYGIGLWLPKQWLPPNNTITILLMLLILLVGISLKNAGVSLKAVLLNKHGVLLAMVFSASVLLAGVVYAYLLPDVGVFQGLAMSSGFGWYSLSAVVMTDAYGAVWGSVALFNDLIRELFALVFIPMIMRRSPAVAVSVGGVTSLDFTLPIIQQSGGVAVIPLTISCSFLLNIISPILMLVFSMLSQL